jgi:hypothetical protein
LVFVGSQASNQVCRETCGRTEIAGAK